MIQIIAGQKGTGKTKRLIDMTNATTRSSDKSIVFVDDDSRYSMDIDHDCRFVDASEYHVKSSEMFMGFLGGMLSSNYDIGTIFVDAFLKLVKADLNDLGWFFKDLEELSVKHDVDFVLCVSADPSAMPAFAAKYII